MWSHIQKQKILNFFRLITRKDSSLNSSTIGNSFIRVDRPVQILTIEIILKEFLNLWNTSGATNKNDFMNSIFIESSISKCLFNWVHCASEEIRAKFFKTSTGN